MSLSKVSRLKVENEKLKNELNNERKDKNKMIALTANQGFLNYKEIQNLNNLEKKLYEEIKKEVKQEYENNFKFLVVDLINKFSKSFNGRLAIDEGMIQHLINRMRQLEEKKIFTPKTSLEDYSWCPSASYYWCKQIYGFPSN